MSFDHLGLSDDILRAIGDAGYSEPTPIQDKAIPHVLRGSDVLGCAQTGTGKTASFTLPMIDILASGRAKARMPRSLILEPTRELAAQVAENFELYGKYHKLAMALLIGGVSFDDQDKLLDRGVDVLIATPGRLLDHFERGKLLLRGVEILVIDESDRMLDMGFIPDVERIVQLLNPNRQTLFFSATMPTEIRKLADRFLTLPKEISVDPPASPAETVEQSVCIVPSADKRAALRTLLRTQPVKNALIFCNRKRDVDIIARSLKKHQFNASALHGDMEQAHRTETLERFRNGDLQLLVCSDVAARGLDIQGLSHVFLFDLPFNPEDYIHRIGRTGRAGMRGRSFGLAAPEDAKLLAAIERLIHRKILRFEVEGLAAELDADERERGGRRRGRRDDEAKPARREPARRDSARRDTARREPAKPEKPASPPKPEIPAESAKSVESATSDEPDRKPPRRRRQRNDDAQADESVVGMGEHVPAFMLRSARPT